MSRIPFRCARGLERTNYASFDSDRRKSIREIRIFVQFVIRSAQYRLPRKLNTFLNTANLSRIESDSKSVHYFAPAAVSSSVATGVKGLVETRRGKGPLKGMGDRFSVRSDARRRRPGPRTSRPGRMRGYGISPGPRGGRRRGRGPESPPRPGGGGRRNCPAPCCTRRR
jgi:hypothetical protein